MKKSLLKQGLVVILAITLMVDGLLGATLYLVVKIAKDNAYGYVVKSNETMLERMDQTLTSLENTCYVMAYSSGVQGMLSDEEAAFPLVDYHKPVRASFSMAFACSQSIAGIGLYDADRAYLLSSGANVFGAEALPAAYADSSVPTYYVAPYGDGTSLFLVYPVYRYTSVDNVIKLKIGYLAVTLSRELLKELVEQSDHVAGTLIAFTDEQGKLIYANQPIDQDAMDRLAAQENGGAHIVSLVEHTGWRLHSVMNNASISDDMKPVMLIMIVIIILLLALFFWLRFFFRRQIIQPLNDLSRFMADNTDIHQRMSLRQRPNNEMRMVMDVLNEMLDKIEKTSNEVLAARTKSLQEKTAQQQMEIIAYRNQINPHFLYNTLDCIRGIAYMHNAMEIVVISQALSSMFRYAVKGENFVTIEEELQYMQNYATIIGYRFDGRITIQDHVDPSLYHCKVIRMLLQPLVENSVLHGLEHIVGKGYAYVTAVEKDQRLIIRVVDNGIGASRQKIEELNRQIEAVQHIEPSSLPTQSGIGVNNIARRLFLHYGTSASLRFMAEEKQGMAVEIILPVEKEA